MSNNAQNNSANPFGNNPTPNDKSSFVSLNNLNSFNQSSDSNPNFPDFYKMIDIENQRRLVRLRNKINIFKLTSLTSLLLTYYLKEISHFFMKFIFNIYIPIKINILL